MIRKVYFCLDYKFADGLNSLKSCPFVVKNIVYQLVCGN